MKKLFTEKSAEKNAGAALYLTVIFVTVATELLLLLFSVVTAEAVRSSNTLYDVKTRLIAESAAEELRASLIDCTDNETEIETVLDNFVPSFSDTAEISFERGSVENKDEVITVSDCSFTVTDEKGNFMTMTLSYKIKPSTETPSDADHIVYYNISFDSRKGSAP